MKHNYCCSLIIPVYNVEKWIRNSLLSAINQSYTNIEIIIVDDCGADSSMDIVMDIIKKYPEKKFKIIRHATNKGLSIARNSGLLAASGEYIFFMDSDDTISIDCIEKHLCYLEKSGVDFTDGNVSLSNGKKFFKVYKNTKQIIGKSSLLYAYYSEDLHICAWNKLIRRDLLIKSGIRFVPNIYYEDSVWLLDLLEKANSCICISDNTYLYNIHDNSITTTLDLNIIDKQYKSWNYILTDICKRIQNYKDKDLSIAAKKWIGKIRFKILFRGMNLISKSYNMEDKLKLVSYSMMKANSKGIFGICSNLPLNVFKVLFILPAKIMKK